MDLCSCLTGLSVGALLLFIIFLRPRQRSINIFLKTFSRDINLYIMAVTVMMKTLFLSLRKTTAISRFNAVVKKCPDKRCFLFEDQVWTFKQVDEYSNKIAHIFDRAGFVKGDVVGLDMHNCPEYVCIWLGLAKIGVVTALINTNLKNDPLIHCLTAVPCKAVIYSTELAEAVDEIRSSLDTDMKYFQLGGTDTREHTINVSDELLTADASPITRPIDPNDHLVYIYTSGTTGLPKAAILPHFRYALILVFWETVIGISANNIDYCPLPLYHMAGGMLGVSVALQLGGTVVLKKKFSASAFIEDCIKYNCTVGQYIGEMCRYMLSSKEKPSDRQHKLQKMVGNGLRPSIWTSFVNRFNIPQVMEVYGSTEGNLQFVNLDNTVGAVGTIPRLVPFLSKYFGVIIKVDPDTMELIRGSDSLCIPCAAGEPGMLVGIIPRKISLKRFYGYVNKEESEKKHIYDILKKGDKAFISGDLVVVDELGYLYFKDRTGDTFRWKGENVATSEVEAVLSKLVNHQDCVVYGVQIGELEGKAGMAAIVDPTNQLDLNALTASMDKVLPKYAQPVFIRILSEIELTGTFKPMKITLTKEAFDLSVIKDPVYFRKGGTYVPLTQELHDQIVSGAIPV